MISFSRRIHIAMRAADMTVSDLAVWFDRPRSTVKTWDDGRTPQGPSGRVAEWRLQLLEWAIKTEFKMPVPDTLSGTERPGYVRGARNDAERKSSVPQVRAAE